MSGHEEHSSRDVRLLLAAMGLNSLPMGYTLVVLPIYLNQIGFSAEAIGTITSASAIANAIAIVPFAIAADRYGRKRFIVGGFLSATLAYIFFAYTRDLNYLLLASAIGGVGYVGGVSAAVWTPAWTALLAEKTSPEGRTTAFAWSQGIWTIALTSGSAMSVLPAFFRATFQVSLLSSYEYTFLIYAGLSILSGLAVWPITEAKSQSFGSNSAPATKFLPKKSTAQIVKFSASFGLVGFASGIAIQLLSLWFNKIYGTSETVIGPWFAAAEITSIIVIPIVPRLTRSWGSPRSILATQGISAVLLGSMIAAPTYQLAGLLYIARNFLMNMSWPIQQSYLMGTVTPDERASASAITYATWGVGGSVSPILAGYLLGGTSFLSLSAPLLIGAATYLVSAIAFYSFFRRIHPPDETPAWNRR